MKKLYLLLGLALSISALTWAGSAVTKALLQKAPEAPAAENVTRAGFEPGTLVTDVASITEGMAYVLRTERGYLLSSSVISDKLCGSKGSGASFLFAVIGLAGVGVVALFALDKEIWKLEKE